MPEFGHKKYPADYPVIRVLVGYHGDECAEGFRTTAITFPPNLIYRGRLAEKAAFWRGTAR
jgi:hypothetical protein